MSKLYVIDYNLINYDHPLTASARAIFWKNRLTEDPLTLFVIGLGGSRPLHTYGGLEVSAPIKPRLCPRAGAKR